MTSSASDCNVDTLMRHVKYAFSSDDTRKLGEYKWDLLKELSTYLCIEAVLEDAYSESIVSNNYILLSHLLSSLKPTLFTEKWQEDLFDRIFLKGIHHDSYMVLTRELQTRSPSFQQDKILDLLEKFLLSDNLWLLFFSQSISCKMWNLKFIAASGFWDELITLIISLPERVANIKSGHVKKIFSSNTFITLIVSAVLKGLNKIHEVLLNEKDCSLEFLGKLLGRLCIAGHSSNVIKQLTGQLTEMCAKDFAWRRVSQNLISKIPLRSLEAFVTPLLLNIPWYGQVEWFLDDAVIKNQKLNYLVTVKFLLIRTFQNDLMLQNIIGYLANSNSRRKLFYETLSTLLDAWGDESALKLQNYSQQYYLSSALMIYAGHLKRIEADANKQVLINKLLHGVQTRISSPEASVRSLSMIVAENLTHILDPDGPQLKFEYEKTPDLDHLLQLMNLPVEPDTSSLNEKVSSESEKCNLQRNEIANLVPKYSSEISEYKIGSDTTLDDLDSDDDLEPYDMSNDPPLMASQYPLYIRDCMDGLMEQNKPEWTEACLKDAEKLIHSSQSNINEVAVEMVKILLHLEDSYSIHDFIRLRHRALIAVTVECPVQVAKYLTAQFYEKNYNICQRLDILEVLASASQELSQLNNIQKKEPEYIKPEFLKATEKHWKVILQERIKSKTKIISKGRKKDISEPKENCFGSVAGFFFFPLLEKYDKKGNALDLLGNDSYVLGRLLYALGIIMYCSTHTLISKQMSSSLLHFLKTVRNHSERFVRQAAIFAMSTIFISVFPHLLVTEMQEDVVECQQWLQYVIEKDPDIECQIKAAKVLTLLINTIKEEIPCLINNTN